MKRLSPADLTARVPNGVPIEFTATTAHARIDGIDYVADLPPAGEVSERETAEVSS